MSDKLFIHALIISDENGNFFVDVIRNKKLETARLSGFISALKMFGEETLGNIKSITIDGLDINMMVVSKYDLIFIAIMDNDLPETNFREGCIKALDQFYQRYHEELESWDGSLQKFREFRKTLKIQIANYIRNLTQYLASAPQELEEFNKLKSQLSSYNERFYRKRGERS